MVVFQSTYLILPTAFKTSRVPLPMGRGPSLSCVLLSFSQMFTEHLLCARHGVGDCEGAPLPSWAVLSSWERAAVNKWINL